MLRPSALWVGLFASVATFAAAAGSLVAAPAPQAPQARVSVAEGDPRILTTLLRQGQDALRAGSFKAARDSFSDALSLDKKNPVALEGAGTAYLHLQDFPRARSALEQAVEAAGAKGPSRSLVLNLVAVHLRQKNPMRAAKLARDYIGAHPDPVDEPVLNALGVALSQADETARRAALFRESAKLYEAANARLEATRPGVKRWGIEWVPQADWSARDAKWKSQQAAADQKYTALAAKRNELSRAQKELSTATRTMGLRRASPGQVEQLRRRVADASAASAAAEKEYSGAIAAVERPKFPLTVEPVEAAPVAVAAGPAIRIDVQKRPRAGVPAAPSGGGRGASPDAEPPMPDPAAAQAGAPAHRGGVVVYAAAFAVAPDLVVTAASALENAQELTVQSADGTAWGATVVRKDETTGLALLRLGGNAAKLIPLPVSDAFAAGAVSCVSFPSVNIFDPAPERLEGAAPSAKEGWTVRLARHPRLGGGPLLAGGKVVGVELASRDSDAARVPAATLEQLKQLLGEDARPPARPPADPAASTVQLTAVREGAR